MNKPLENEHNCAWCSKLFSSRAHNAMYCSRYCAGRSSKRRSNIKRGQSIPLVRDCDVCSTSFCPTFEKEWVCSNKCRLLSPINWSSRSYTKEELTEAVKVSYSYASLARNLDLSIYGTTNSTLKAAIIALNLDTSHFMGQAHSRGRVFTMEKRDISDYLVKGVKVSTHKFKNRLWNEGLKEKKCEECGITEWNGKEAPLCLDHINGDNTDNRFDNLKILCHNCHAQTETFAGKKLRKNFCVHCGLHQSSSGRVYCECGKPWRGELQLGRMGGQPAGPRGSRKPLPNKTCIDCQRVISYKAERCKSCARKASGDTKIEWPDSNTLYKMVTESNYTRVGKILGVSDNAIRKRLKNHPPLA